eukprot:3932831-Rhodomonas_salina.1
MYQAGREVIPATPLRAAYALPGTAYALPGTDVQYGVGVVYGAGTLHGGTAGGTDIRTGCTRAIESKQLGPTVRTQYMRTAFQVRVLPTCYSYSAGSLVPSS